MAKLSKTFENSKSLLVLEVEWNPDEQQVEKIISLQASLPQWMQHLDNPFDFEAKPKPATQIDLTHHFNDHFPDQLESMVDSIDWAAEYADGVDEDKIPLENE